MAELPEDLVPIPTQPWDTRPSELPIDIEEARTALWRAAGNITDAAHILKTTSGRLRNFVKKSQYLTREVEEAREQLVDKAEGVVRDALDDPERQDAMARFVLSSQGRVRGWGSGASNMKINNAGGNITIQWADGSALTGDDSQTIEGEVVDG